MLVEAMGAGFAQAKDGYHGGIQEDVSALATNAATPSRQPRWLYIVLTNVPGKMPKDNNDPNRSNGEKAAR